MPLLNGGEDQITTEHTPTDGYWPSSGLCCLPILVYTHKVPLRKAGIMDGSVAEPIPCIDVPGGGTSYNHPANVQHLLPTVYSLCFASQPKVRNRACAGGNGKSAVTE